MKTDTAFYVMLNLGRYYARVFTNGKEVWKWLKTAHFSVAKARLTTFAQEDREKLAASITHASAEVRFGEAMKLHQQRRPGIVGMRYSRLY